MPAPSVQTSATPRPRRTASEREAIVLDTAARLFYARGVHEVGMDELVRETGLAKPSVYRLFASKDALITAYLERTRVTILHAIDREIAGSATPALAMHRILWAIEADLARPEFRGCPFNNASIEFDDADHPARTVARAYRADLLERLQGLTARLDPTRADDMERLGRRLAALIDGAYTSAAHLGPDGPARDALALAHDLVADAA